MIRFIRRWRQYRALDEIDQKELGQDMVKALIKNNTIVKIKKEKDDAGNSMV